VLLIITNYQFANISNAQSKFNSIGISYSTLENKYPAFNSWDAAALGGVRTIELKSKDISIDCEFTKEIKKKYVFSIGAGYTKRVFEDFTATNKYGVHNSRLINFVSPLTIPFNCDRYYYNLIDLNIGIDRLFFLSKKFIIKTGLQARGYYTYSQYYHLTYNSEGSQDYYKHSNNYFGTNINLNISVLKMFKRILAGPKIILPILTSYKTDDTFLYEGNNSFRDECFKGWGIGFSINYLISKKNENEK
jgi:hypothetical protein